MTKHTGLSQLADVAHESADEKFYPIKKRGGRRYLNPNRHAIAWLEKETADDTRIGELIDVYAGGQWTGSQWILARGWSTARQNGQYVRPMYELFNLEASSSNMRDYANPCPACLDFSRSWACEEHPEIPWDDEKKQWDRPPADPYTPPLPSPGFTVRQADQEEYRRQAALYFQAPSAAYGFEVTLPEISAEERMAAEWEQQHGIPLADVLARVNQAHDELRRSFFRNATLEVNGETVDGNLSFSFEVERGDDDPRFWGVSPA